MPVTPYCNNLFQSRRDLHQFLSACQQEFLEKNHPQIISIALKIEPIDPLMVLQQIAKSDQLSFYFEKREFGREIHSKSNGAAIAAIDAVAKFKLAGSERFAAAKTFIHSTLAQTITAGETQLPFAGPHFFCSFTFFDQNSSQNPQFPAATVFLPAWQVSTLADFSVVVANIAMSGKSNLTALVERLWSTFQAIRSIQYSLFNPAIHQRELLKKSDVTDTRHFEKAVSAVLEAIQTRALNKVVLAHAVDICSPLPFHVPSSLHNLRTLYPDCYLFSVSNGQGQTFIGASPERLVSLRNHSLITDALAGSAPRGKTTCEDAYLANTLLSSAKELHEHRVVIEFIQRRLMRLGLTPHLSPLRLLQLSNIQHLQTPIHAAVASGVHLLDIVAELHPTPAVAGVPRGLACEHIQRHEAFERSLYAAPIGWVDHQGNGEFAVGIRSALLDGCHARLYAGAGIVAGSNPPRELAEVQLKLQALLQALV